MNSEPLINRPGRPKDLAKHDEIVAAATQLFMEKGYALTSMEAVARQANVSKLTIYSHFVDKKELFRAIIQNRCIQTGMPEVFTAETAMSAEEALLKISRMALSVIFRQDSIRLIRIIQTEALRYPEMVQIYYEVGPRRVKKAFADLLASFHQQKKLVVADPARAAEQFFSLLKGEKLQQILMSLIPAPTVDEIETHIQATIRFFLAAYGPQHLASTLREKP